jgi:hypothetical protein
MGVSSLIEHFAQWRAAIHEIFSRLKLSAATSYFQKVKLLTLQSRYEWLFLTMVRFINLCEDAKSIGTAVHGSHEKVVVLPHFRLIEGWRATVFNVTMHICDIVFYDYCPKKAALNIIQANPVRRGSH